MKIETFASMNDLLMSSIYAREFYNQKQEEGRQTNENNGRGEIVKEKEQ